nr:cytochrome P450 [Leptographium qinlingense (nom. inval.)]
MSESQISTLLSTVVHGRLGSLGSFSDLDSVDGWTAALSLAKILSATLLCGFVAKLVYNAFLHPLSKVPGPFWYGASGLPRYWFNSSGYAHLKLHELHAKYGDIVRIAPDEVSFSGPRAWPEIYNHKRVAGGGGHGHDFLENDKDALYFNSVSAPTSIITMPKHAHVTARKSLASAFSAKAVADQEHLVKGHIDMMVKLLRQAAHASAEAHTAVDIASYINWTLFDVIGDLAFGEPFGSLADGAEHVWVSMVPNAVKGGFLRANVNSLLGPRIGHVATQLLVSKKVRDQVTWHRAMSADKFERRRAMGASRPDFVSPMFGNPDFWTTGRMRATATSLITAGSETSSTTLASAVYYLTATHAAHAAHAAQAGDGDTSPWTKICSEVRAEFTSDADITFSSARNLPYLSAVIDETLRLHPPVASGLPRTAREGGIVVEDYYLPANTTMAMAQYATYHSARNFFRPDDFLPERWLAAAADDPRFANDRKDAFQPFSYGPRNCIGRHLAYSEMRAILARIVFNFDIELRPESRGWDRQRSYVVWDKGPLYVNLRNRV